MKIQFKNLTSSCILFALTNLVACSDDMDEGHTPVQPGNIVRFAAYSPATRTIYDDENIFQINWEAGDNIKIYGSKDYNNLSNADYAVTPVETDGEGTNKLYSTGTIAASGTSQLMWADNNEHKFIGVYPNDNSGISVDMDANVVTFPINRNQQCELVTVASDPYYKQKYGEYTYYAKPDMKNAYLVAYNALTPAQAAESDGDVFLNFKPVMTAIEVVVKGVVNTTAKVQVTGISVSRELPSSSTESYSTFRWNAEKASLDYFTNGTPAATNTHTENTFVNLNTTDGTNVVALSNGESIVFTVFIPPFAVNSTYPIKVRVHATGATEVRTKDITNEILASNKRRITLPNFPEAPSSNNWITPLDNDIYVSQLSIPGTHDAATHQVSGLIGSAGRTQELSIEAQLAMGIRAFDLRPTCTNIGGASSGRNPELPIFHGIVDTKTNMREVFTTFNTFLDANPGEFIIVTSRWESEADLHVTTILGKKWDTFNQSMTNFLNSATYYPERRKVDFKPDLTVGEMRGKILIIMRPNQGTDPDGFYAETALKGTVFVSGWPAGGDDVRTGIRFKSKYEGATIGNAVIQDYYDVQNSTTKLNLIKQELQMSATSTDNTWYINHCSGYNGSAAANTSYSNNASVVNPSIYEYLTTEMPSGRTGIVMLDFVGHRVSTASGMTVYGDLLPQAIIDNNYKYRMKRKGE